MTEEEAAQSPPDEGRLDGKRKGRLVVGVIGFLLSAGYLFEAQKLSWGTLAQPGAAAFPMLLGVALAGTSMLTIGESVRTGAVAGAVELPRGVDRKRILGLVGALAAYVVLLPVAGYILASAGFAIAVLRLLSGLSWLRTVVLAIAVTAGTYLLFVMVLGVLMPKGVLGV
ncbi:MAG: hypothetical protein GEU93_20680 [Propionibacteriales bacterium]|nr:hypothetical protein [Propionibacteriales bacterium]MQA06516.1 hypothetical protein [Streptosporangiales bacterium]